jgi:hypothetical protein
MAYIDIDLGEFDFDDLLIEIIDRIPRRKPYTVSEQLLVNKFATILEKNSARNLADEMKMEFLMELKEKYTEAQLREMQSAFQIK